MVGMAMELQRNKSRKLFIICTPAVQLSRMLTERGLQRPFNGGEQSYLIRKAEEWLMLSNFLIQNF